MRATIDARYRVVTPLFCAGAEPDRPESRPELRLPSFKGVLRFWWRALAWSRFRGDIGAILREEDELFGSAKGGQSRVSMRLAPDPHPDSSKISIGKVLTVSQMNQRVVGEGARYLGYGVMEAFASSKKNTKAGQLTRACLRSPFDFTVQMRARDLSEHGLSSLTDALVALGTIGGMGAKSRKGYGSLVIRSLHVNGEEHWHAPQAMNDLRDAIAGLRYGDTSATLPEFTALSTRTRHVLISSNQKEPVELLDLVGRELVRYRSWGHGGKILGSRIDSEKNFEDDHNLMKGRLRKTHPRRIAFGLPHNYGKHDDQQVGPDDKHLDRRASPLFIHIHECHSIPVAVLSFLPARFLPKGKSAISVGGNRVPQTPEANLYRPIHDFLDRLLDPKKRVEPFTNAVEVRS